MHVRSLLALLAVVFLGCGGKVAGDDQDTPDATPIVPVEETGVPDYERCDDKLAPSWATGCGGAAVDHGEICATPAGLARCRALDDACDGPSPDEILLHCDPSFFSRPGAKFGVDIDANGCVTGIEWSNVALEYVQCATDALTRSRFPCTGSTTVTTPCTPMH